MLVRRSLLFAQTCLALSCAMLAGVAAAQANKEPVKNLSVVEVEYKSALSDFRPYNDQAIQSWCQSHRLGRSYWGLAQLCQGGRDR